MLLVDETKAVLVGQADKVITELAFLMDKLCIDTNKADLSYDETQKLILEKVKVFRKERTSGISRNHPHEDPDDTSMGSTSVKSDAAEAALAEALSEIKAMREDRIAKEAKKKIKKAKKAKKKDA